MGNTALHLAAGCDSETSIKLLLQDTRPAYREMRNLRGQTALHMVSNHFTSVGMSYLLKSSRSRYREIQDVDGNSSLHAVCTSQNRDGVRLLLQNSRIGFSQIQNNVGQTAVQCVGRNHRIVPIVLTAKYTKLMLSLAANTLHVTDDKDMFWCVDSIVKETLPWIIGFDNYDFPSENEE
eukprot:TRINITY_DN12946_c0_g4_i1.p1 TRINITY_DN12946_c0_g4~~TRINITY_DN12946_c0_g4_i1.p1  ORF type:complete len:179 (-),score=25.71 TRINITY_DN12946_c0_g4_i1:149-685(-)